MVAGALQRILPELVAQLSGLNLPRQTQQHEARSVASSRARAGRSALAAAARDRESQAQAEVAVLQAKLDRKVKEALNASREVDVIIGAGSRDDASSHGSQSIAEADFIRGMAGNTGGGAGGNRAPASRAGNGNSNKSKARSRRGSQQGQGSDILTHTDVPMQASGVIGTSPLPTAARVVSTPPYNEVVIEKIELLGGLPPDNSESDPT